MKQSMKTSISFSIWCILSWSLAGCSTPNKESSNMPEEKKMKANPSSTQTNGPLTNTEEPSKPNPSEKDSHPQGAESKQAHWSYNGLTGPQLWGDLDPAFQLCKTGDNQSPIDLKWTKPQEKRPIEIKYQASQLRIIDNGHTIQVNADPGSLIRINGTDYELLQLHFHSESEHTLSGKRYPMEVHFVHRAKDGQHAVLGRMITIGKKSDPFIEKILSHLPKEKNQELIVSGQTVDFSLGLPKEKTYYNYSGSLTTPPCTEGVDWNFLNTPLTISKDQLSTFRSIYANNARPIQQKNNRKPANY
ncbi:MAG: carbonic anhydrase family protein [Bdellovibrionales bacterium]|nr:carbonic anhydrase family protein [Bdellovibrionales bacterium]